MTMLSKLEGIECKRTDLIANANCEYDSLCFILVPLSPASPIDEIDNR